ncbi:putative phosphoribosylaminoimidazole-succinocarboxamide synthase [Hortaea werneckii]|nr:putative phosphoribosylaminoimidazole-succinocarboxamide synthase [Hortaea werneckii]
MSSDQVVTKIDLESHGFKKVASGKVREIYELDNDTLLFVATDRISAYDVILDNGIPTKGALLTQLSTHWFSLIAHELPHLKTHLLSTSLPASIPSSLRPALENRTMQVRKHPILPLESIVRGYITGSAWAEYQRSGTVHGIPMPGGLKESQKLEQPIWTPSTKAEQGEHDENISPAKAREVVGEGVAGKVEEVSLKVYGMARDYAEARGILIADTKFEFGLDPTTNEIVLVDEVLTPDSSRFWPAEGYQVGNGQSSYDKQYLRDWLVSSGLKGKQGVSMPEEVAQETGRKYREAYAKITGKEWVTSSAED